MAYVPAYMGNSCKVHANSHLDEEYNASIQQVLDVEEMPIKLRSSGLWDIQV